MKKDITSLEDIKLMVSTFYGKIRQDDLLKDIFNEKIQDLWPEHLEKMYRFWQTVLLDEHTYNGAPFPPHAQLIVEKEHFDRWISLFFSTIEENFEGENAEKAKLQGERMALIFHAKITYFKNQNLNYEK